MSDFGKATHADAELVLKLYDMRRETVMREARKFMANFNPQSGEEVANLFFNFSSNESAYIRQVVSFWEMAAALVLRGSLHEGLFLDTAGELFFVFAKFAPILADVREKLDQPAFMAKSEELINHTSEAQERLAATIERQKKMAARRAQAGR